MKNKNYNVIPTREMQRMRRALTLCQRLIDLSMSSTLINESNLAESSDKYLGCFEKEMRPYQLSVKELEEIF